MTTNRRHAAIALVMLGLSCIGARGDQPSTRMTLRFESADDVLPWLLRQRLELSTLDSSAAVEFSLSMTVSGVKDNWFGTAFEVLVERDGAHVAYLCRYGDELTSLFVGNGISVWYDPAHPGELRMIRGVHPRLLLIPDEGFLYFRLGVTEDQRRAEVKFDLASIIADPKTLLRRTWDPLRERLVIEREESLSFVPISGDGYPIKSFRSVNTSAKIIDLEEIRIGADARRTLLGVTEASFKDSGLPIRVVTAADADTAGKFPQGGDAPNNDVELLHAFEKVMAAAQP